MAQASEVKWLLAAVALAAALGCGRSFSKIEAPEPVKAQLGVSCVSAGDCASGICTEGVCCEAACGTTESCNVPGAAGHCTARPLGAACAGHAECPSGACVDGVCCESACDGTCVSCALAGSAGRCVRATDGTDPRGMCGYACTACYAGECGAAPLGTNPEGRCDTGLVCGVDQRCASATGAVCQTDADCAPGTCFAGVCILQSIEEVPLFAWAHPDATARHLLASAVSGAGAAALVIGEVTGLCTQPSPGTPNGYGPQDVSEDSVLLAERAPDGTWSNSKLFDSREVDCGEVPAAATYLGQTLVIALFSETHFTYGVPGCSSATSSSPCGVFILDRSPSGTAVEIVDDQANATTAIALATSPDGRLGLAYDSLNAAGERHLYFNVRTQGLGWGQPTDIGPLDDAESTFLAPRTPRAAFGLASTGADFFAVYLPDQAGASKLNMWSSATGTSMPLALSDAVSSSCDAGFVGPVFAGSTADGFVASVGCFDPDLPWPLTYYLPRYLPDGTPAGERLITGTVGDVDSLPIPLATPVQAGAATVSTSYLFSNSMPAFSIAYDTGSSTQVITDNFSGGEGDGTDLDSVTVASGPNALTAIAWSTIDGASLPIRLALLHR